MLPSPNSCTWTQKSLGYPSQGGKVPQNHCKSCNHCQHSAILFIFPLFKNFKTSYMHVYVTRECNPYISYLFIFLNFFFLGLLFSKLCPVWKCKLQLKRENAACNRLLMPSYDLYNWWASNNLEMKNDLSTLWCVETLFLPFILKPILFG